MSSEMRQHCPIISEISGSLNLNSSSTVLIGVYLMIPSSTYSNLSYYSKLMFLDSTTFFIFSSITIYSSYSTGIVSGINYFS